MSTPNPLKGEAELGGRLIRMNFDRWCALETATGKKVTELLGSFDSGLGLAELRDWLRVFLVEDVSDEEIAELLTEGGAQAGYKAGLKALGDAMTGYFAPPAKEKKANPPLAA